MIYPSLSLSFIEEHWFIRMKQRESPSTFELKFIIIIIFLTRAIAREATSLLLYIFMSYRVYIYTFDTIFT